jgi:transcriptional regulator with XRE-family HTH domain
VGHHVRRLREEKGLSLRGLAEQTGFSPSFISQLERGLVSPSINSMEKIAGVLGQSLGGFFAGVGGAEGGLIVRASERQTMPSSWSKGDIETLSPMRQGRRLEPLLISLEPGGRSGKHPVAHPTEEFAYVLEGTLDLTLGPDVHSLAAGDAVTILSQELRLWVNNSAALARVIIVASRH